jgi:hypothetical protein
VSYENYDKEIIHNTISGPDDYVTLLEDAVPESPKHTYSVVLLRQFSSLSISLQKDLHTLQKVIETNIKQYSVNNFHDGK